MGASIYSLTDTQTRKKLQTSGNQINVYISFEILNVVRIYYEHGKTRINHKKTVIGEGKEHEHTYTIIFSSL